MLRDFTYIDDIINGLFSIFNKFTATDDSINKIYNIGFGKPVILNKFIEILEDILGKKAKKNYMPFQSGDVHKTFADIASLKSDFDYEPKINIEAGLVNWVNWYKSYIKD